MCSIYPTSNRGGMVQTAEQYEFIHRALALYEATLPIATTDWRQASATSKLLQIGTIEPPAQFCSNNDSFPPAQCHQASKTECLANGVTETKLVEATIHPSKSNTTRVDHDVSVTIPSDAEGAEHCAETYKSHAHTCCSRKPITTHEYKNVLVNYNTDPHDTSDSCTSTTMNGIHVNKNSSSNYEHLNDSYNFGAAAGCSRDSTNDAANAGASSSGGALDWLRNTFGSSSGPSTGTNNSPNNSCCSSTANLNGNLEGSSYSRRNSSDRLSPPESKRQKTLLEKTCAIWEGFEPLKTSRTLTVSEWRQQSRFWAFKAWLYSSHSRNSSVTFSRRTSNNVRDSKLHLFQKSS